MNRERKNTERAGSGGTVKDSYSAKEKTSIKGGASKATTDQYGSSLNRKSWKGDKGRKDWK